MNELVDLVVKKTGIPAPTAEKAINIVVDYLKKKLPAPIAAQVDGVLNNSGNLKKAQDILGGLGSKIGKKK
jgi:hypothetical protein